MWATILKGIWSHKRRLLSTSTAVVLGVAFLVATLSLGDTLNAGFDSLYTDANAGTDVVVRDADEIGADDQQVRGTLDATVLERIAAVDGVAAAAPVIEGTGQIVAADGDPLGGNGPPTTATNWLDDPTINPYRLAEGRPPRPAGGDGPYEVVIDRSSATTGHLGVGDHTTVRVPRAVDVTVVGIVTFGEADSLGPTTYAGFALADATELLGRPGQLSEVRVAAVDGVDPTALRARIAEVLPTGAEALTGAELTDEQMADIRSDFLGMFQTILLSFAGVALVVASFSIHNTFSILVAQRTRESALLRAVGASRRQVLTSVVVEALAVGLVASAIGLAIGAGLAVGLDAVISGLGPDLPGAGVMLAADTIIVSLAVGVIVSLLASVIPAVRASRVPPLAALRDVAVDRTATSPVRGVLGAVTTAAGVALVVTATSSPDGAVARAGLGALATLVGSIVLGPVVARPAAAVLGGVAAAVRGQTGRLARRNAMRNPRRTAGSASALMVGTAVVALFTTVGASITASIEDTVDRSFGGDLVIAQENFSGAGISPDATTAIGELPEVASSVGLGAALARVDGVDQAPTATDPAALQAILDLDVRTGSMNDVGPGELAVSQHYADGHGLRLGSPVTMQFADGARTGFAVAAVYGERDTVGDLVMTSADWLPHASQPTEVAVLVDLAPGVDLADGEAAVAVVADRFGTPDVQTRDEYVDSIGDQVDQMLFVVYGLLGIAVLIALMGIANTLSLSIHERTRELGLLRAVGQTRRQVRSAVRWESVIVAVFGTIGGLGIGTFLGWGLIRAVSVQEGFGVFAAPVTTLAVILALAAAAGVVAAIRPARRAARLDVLTAIASD